MSEKKDLYKVLGMAPDATNPEIKKAYLVDTIASRASLLAQINSHLTFRLIQAKVKIFFPDRAPEGKKDEYTAIFIEIKEAGEDTSDFIDTHYFNGAVH